MACLVLVAGGVSAAESAIFSRLAQIEERERRHRESAALAEREVDRWAESLDGLTPTGDLASRTRDRLRRRIAAKLMRWESVHRRLRRRRLVTPPGDLRDTAVLLRRAERRVMEREADEFEGFRRLTQEQSGRDGFVVRRADVTVRFARHRGAGDAMERARERAVERLARRPTAQLREAIADATETLESVLDEAWSHATDRDFHRRKGALHRPVAAAPARTSDEPSDGERRVLPVYDVRPGLVYRVDEGTDVVAVGRGRVVVAERVEGYGRTVVVDHGDGYRSVYAHLASIDVDPGESVGREARLGSSGASESLAGPLFYFEFRDGDEVLDPSAWFVQR